MMSDCTADSSSKLPAGMRINAYGEVERLELNLSDWEKRWERGHCGFHKTEVHSNLLKHLNRILPKRGRVLVPLCGKSVDLKYLAELGNDVVGIELTEKAVKAFFDESNVKYTVGKEGPFNIYKGGGITIYNGDFFKLTEVQVGKFDAVWDRGSFASINPTDREKYVITIKSLMNRNCSYLLNAFNYETDTFIGPPHSITDDEICSYFAGDCDITKLDAVESITPKQKEMGLKTFIIKNFLIKLKIDLI